MRNGWLSGCIAAVFSLHMFHSMAQAPIIPAPVAYATTPGQFILNAEVAISAPHAEAAPLAAWLHERLAAAGILLTGKKEKPQRQIMLGISASPNAALGTEGYQLQINPDMINLVANGPAGLFYGMHSLLQLMPVNNPSGVAAIPACTITDYPRFGWRGLMLDVSRHFFAVAEVKQYIDLMAHYKLNVFHWHLTDDNGWRIEIKSYPKLTEVGACRVVRYGTFGDRIAPQPGEPTTDCGYYTQEEIKDIVAYAKARYVTIVPEIDVPGHSLAAIAAYPELSITKEKQLVSPGHKFSEWYGNGTFKMLLDNTLNPADEKVYAFLDKVFGEVAALFPGEYIHAGGDECYHGYWEKSPEVQAFMKKQGIIDVHGMQSYFMQRVAQIIAAKGKKMIGWDEIMDGGLAKGAVVMSWRGMKGGIEAAKLGHKVVMSPTTHAYLDYMQADASLEPRVYASLLLQTCYEFDPLPQGIDAALVLGGQANLWTEKVPHYRHATYMTYPRSWAISEALWSPKEQKHWPDFVRRTELHFERADAMQLHVSRALYDVVVKTTQEGKKILVHLSCQSPDAMVHYTLDGSHPDVFSPVYTQPIALPEGPIVLRATTSRGGKVLGRTVVLPREELLKRK
jgi:hexosaminidase